MTIEEQLTELRIRLAELLTVFQSNEVHRAFADMYEARRAEAQRWADEPGIGQSSRDRLLQSVKRYTFYRDNHLRQLVDQMGWGNALSLALISLPEVSLPDLPE